MAKDTLKIAITGHVDHGKSTLIGRLLIDTNSLPKDKVQELERIARELGKDAELAYLTDQLKEEREQDKTIDTTQTFFKTRKRNFVIIDTPGHTEFLRNMLTGTSMAEAAVLIVDASEGMKEQTRRHAYLISMLGIEKVIVVINKMDLLNFDKKIFDKISADIVEFFKNLSIKPLSIIPISAKRGTNIISKSKEINWYKGNTLIETLESINISEKKEEKPLRFTVQDIYSINGQKVLVGSISSGKIFLGQKIQILPQGKSSRVKSIKVFQKEKKEAFEGENIGIIIDDDFPVERGNIISDLKTPAKPVYNFSGEIFWMSNEPLKKDSRLTLRIATQEGDCVISEIKQRIDSSSLQIVEDDAKELFANEVGIVKIKTSKPFVIENFSFIEPLGRFVIEKDYNLLGAGIIKTL